MGGKGDSTTQTTSQIPPELLPLYQQSAGNIMAMQGAAPLQAFMNPGQPVPVYQPYQQPQPQMGQVSVQQPVQNQFGIQPGQVVDGFTLGSDGIWYDQNGHGQGNNWQPPSIRRALGLSPVSNAPLTPTQTQQAQGIWNTNTRSAPSQDFLSGQTPQQAPKTAQQTYNLPMPYQTAARAPEFAKTQTLLNQAMPIASQRSPWERSVAQRPQGTTDAIRAANQMIGTSQRMPANAQAALQAAYQLPASLGGLDSRPQGTRDALNLANQLFSMSGTQPGSLGKLNNQTQGMTNALLTGQDIRSLANQIPGALGLLSNQTQGTTAALGTATGMQDIARRQVTGANIQQDPAYQAAIKAFESAILPQVQNQAALQGLGRTTGLGQATAASQAQYLLPVVQDTLAREERGIDRELGAGQFLTGVQQGAGQEEYNRILSQLQGQENIIGRQMGAGQFMAGLQQAAGVEEYNRILSQIATQENTLNRQQMAGQFASGQHMTAGNQDLNRLLQKIGYQQQGIQNQIGGQQFMVGTQQQQIANELAARQGMVGLQQATGNQDLQRQLALLGTDQDRFNRQQQALQFAVPAQQSLAQSQQEYAQSGLDRQTQDFLRRQALSEQALYQPFGMIAPTAIGQTATTSGKK